MRDIMFLLYTAQNSSTEKLENGAETSSIWDVLFKSTLAPPPRIIPDYIDYYLQLEQDIPGQTSAHL